MKKKEEKGTVLAQKIQRNLLQTLKKEDSYSPLYKEMGRVAGVVGALFWQLGNDLLNGETDYTETITSREGNERYKQNPKWQLFIQLLDRYQDALKALGMNVDSKPVRKKEKGIDEFLNSFREDD